MMKWQIQCLVCDKKGTFGDAHDIVFAKWHIVGWNVKTAEPMCLCPGCEYGKPKGKQNDNAKK